MAYQTKQIPEDSEGCQFELYSPRNPTGAGEKGGATPVRSPLTVHAHSATGPQHQGGATPTMGTDGSPLVGAPASESHARSISCGGLCENGFDR